LKTFLFILLLPSFLKAQTKDFELSEKLIQTILSKQETKRFLKGEIPGLCINVDTTYFNQDAFNFNLSDSLLPNSYVMPIVSKLVASRDSSCIQDLGLKLINPNNERGTIKGKYSTSAAYRIYLVRQVGEVKAMIVVQENTQNIVSDKLKIGEINYIFLAPYDANTLKVVGVKIIYN
jgi:hypothetical protein